MDITGHESNIRAFTEAEKAEQERLWLLLGDIVHRAIGLRLNDLQDALVERGQILPMQRPSQIKFDRGDGTFVADGMTVL